MEKLRRAIGMNQQAPAGGKCGVGPYRGDA
jgi:hypothetical protein